MVNYESKNVDDLYVKLKNEADNTKRDAMLAEVQEQLMTDVTWVPVVEYPNTVGTLRQTVGH